MASDGSRQVKIHVACPQCRSKYPVDDLEETVLLLRSAHALAESIMTKVVDDDGVPVVATASASACDDSDNSDVDVGVEETKKGPSNSTPKTTAATTETETETTTPAEQHKYKIVRDSNLTASQLARKSEFASQEARKQLEEASLLYEKAIAKSGAYRKDADDTPANHAKAQRESARAMWLALLDQLPAEPDNACRCEIGVNGCDGSCGSRNSIEVVLQPTGSHSPATPSPTSKISVMDDTLFQGFDEFMNRDEKNFLTDLFTDGDVRSVSQAALIMNGVRRLALSGKHKIKRSHEEPMTKQEMQKHIDFIDQMKVQFPLPNYMPGYFLIPTYSYREGYMTLKDKPWDGTMTPPQRSKRVFEKVYGKFYTRPRSKDSYPLTVATVQAVRGPIGRLGLRRDDIITHVNDAEWTGTAEDLQAYIYDCHTKHPRNEISITVNANPETCEFLKIRNEMMQRSAREQKERQKQKALLRKQQYQNQNNANAANQSTAAAAARARG
jgi:hypothetical protein